MGIHYGKADFINYGKPSLLLDFARNKSLVDRISGNNLITFERASTGTYVGADGLIKTAAADEPRFDFDPVTGESLGLLIEESRTNFLPYSENFVGNYTLTNVTLNANSTISPSGDLDATTVTATLNTATGVEYSQSFSNLVNYTISLFVKRKSGSNTFQIRSAGGATSRIQATFSLENETSSYLNQATSSSIISYPNGWFKCSVSGPISSDENRIIFLNGMTLNEEFYIWGSQLELGSFPTSYIPTSGSAVTREPDITKITGTNFSSWYNQNEGTIVYESALTHFPRNLAYRRLFSINAGTGSQDNVIHAIAVESNTTVLSAIWNNSSPQYTQYSRGLSNYVANDLKFTIGYKDNDVRSYIESAGFLDAVADNNVTIPKSMVRFDIGHVLDVSHPAKLHVKQIRYYPERLTNDQLQELTAQ
jgi:hypothetical protein